MVGRVGGLLITAMLSTAANFGGLKHFNLRPNAAYFVGSHESSIVSNNVHVLRAEYRSLRLSTDKISPPRQPGNG